MNYIYKLVFEDKIEADSVLRPNQINEDGEIIGITPEWMQSVETIVEIGVITKPATYDEDGNELTSAQVINGWHVDILAHSLIDELKEYVPEVPPTNPVHGLDWAMGEKFIIVTKQDYL